MLRLGLFVALFLIPSLVSGAAPSGIWLPRVATTKVVTKTVVREAARGVCGEKGCSQKIEVVKRLFKRSPFRR
jgi:hypothetical protein